MLECYNCGKEVHDAKFACDECYDRCSKLEERKMKYCANYHCGDYKTITEFSDLFCSKCSQRLTPIEKPEEPEKSDKKYCECGWCNPDENRCCGGCGGEFEIPPKKVCVKTAVMDVLGRLIMEYRNIESCHWKLKEERAALKVQNLRFLLQDKVEKLGMISDSQYEHACYDVQNS